MATTTQVRAPELETGSGKPRYTRVAVTGLVLAALAPGLLLTLGAAFGLDVGPMLGFFGVLTVVPLVVAALVWRYGIWAKILGILASLASGFTLFWLAFGLGEPSSFGDFLAGVLLPLGVLLGLIGSIAAIVASRRGRADAAATTGERRIIAGAIGVVVIAAIVSGALNLLGRTTVDEAAAAGAPEVTMKDFTFVEGSYQVSANSEATVVVRNDDPFLHDFTIPELGVAVELLPGSAQLVELNAAPGEYTIYCTLHSNPEEPPEPGDMAATLIVN